jgi:hypothetical protein
LTKFQRRAKTRTISTLLLRFTTRAQPLKPPFILDHYHIKFSAEGARNVYDAAPEQCDGSPKIVTKTTGGSRLAEGSANPKVQVGRNMTEQKEETHYSISPQYRERINRGDPLCSFWEFRLAREGSPKDSIITVRPEASLLPTSTFYFPNGGEQPISIMIASHYTLVNPQFKFRARTPNNATVGWRNFYHEMLIDMPVVGWPEGDPILRTVYPTMAPSDQQTTGKSSQILCIAAILTCLNFRSVQSGKG